jgi:hypothetical protein
MYVDLAFCCVVRVFSHFFSYLVWRFTSMTSGCAKQFTICIKNPNRFKKRIWFP